MANLFGTWLKTGHSKSQECSIPYWVERAFESFPELEILTAHTTSGLITFTRDLAHQQQSDSAPVLADSED